MNFLNPRTLTFILLINIRFLKKFQEEKINKIIKHIFPNFGKRSFTWILENEKDIHETVKL